MSDEFVQYARQRIAASTDGNRFRMWGEFGEYGADDVHPTGISFHYPDSWSELTPGENGQPRVSKLESLATLASTADVPLIWFGEHHVSWRGGRGTIEIGELTANGDGTFTADLETVDIADLEPTIQRLLGTDLEGRGASKPENERINSFQSYTRDQLPTAYVIQDIDLLVEGEPGEPAALVELKRSTAGPRDWTPYSNDWPNYYLQIHLAELSGVEPLLVHHGKALLDDREVGFYYDLERPESPNTKSDTAFLEWNREILTARETRERLRTVKFYGDR